MTAWGDLIDAGYRRVLGVTIEGIPIAFLEHELLTTADALITIPSAWSGVRPALRVRDSDAISQELDRKTGLGRGRALDIILAVDQLGTSAELFQRPSLRARLTADVNGTATTFPVDSTAGFAGKFYIGREFCTYASSTATSFTSVTRAVAGWAHYHPSSAASGYRFATDRPQYWRGRFVTLWEHLVGPDGRALAATAFSVGTYCRELWKGYIDAQPQVDGRQMMLRCLPIERLFAQDLGGTAKGEVLSAYPGATGRVTPEWGYVPVIVTPTDSIYLSDNTANLETTWRATLSGRRLMTAYQFVQTVVGEAVRTLYVGSVFAFSTVGFTQATDTSPAQFRVRIRVERANPPHTPHDVALEFSAWFLTEVTSSYVLQDIVRAGVREREVFIEYLVELDPNAEPYAWLVVVPELEADGQPATWPSSGYVLLENEEGLELAAFSEVDNAIDPASQYIGVKLSERALMGTQRINPYKSQTRITVVPGARGNIADVIGTLGQSSGTGTRGTLDTLGYGLGLAIPEDWFDVRVYPLTSQFVDGLSDDKASVENVAGGWLALMGRCLTQRQQADGYVRLVAASTTLEVAGAALVVGAGDVLINTLKAERLFESPNVIRLEDSLRQRRTVSVVRDVPRQQAEGAREATFIAPGINTASALIYGGKMLALADGQLVVTFGVRAGLNLGVGDLCLLDVQHPAIWDFSTGAVGIEMPARVIGASDNLGTGARTLTFLVPGQQQAAKTLCPAARVDGYLSSTFISVDDAFGFEAGMVVTFYRRGLEATTGAVRTIASVASNLIVLTSALSSVTFPADGDTWVTYADYPGGTAAQDVHLYIGQGDFEA